MQVVRIPDHGLPVARLRWMPLVGGLLMGAAALSALIFIAVGSDAFRPYPYAFLLPWVLGLAVVLITPSAYLAYKGQFSLTDPIVFLTWTYLIPAFVLGGLFFAGGWSQPYFAAFIQDAEQTLPFTLILVAIGFAGLCAGYFARFSARLGARIERILPKADHNDDAFIIPGYVLFVLGVLNTIIAFIVGIIGFQHGEQVNSYDGLIYLTTLFWAEGTFLLWSVIFRSRKLNLAHWATAAVLVVSALIRAAFSGSRAALIAMGITVGLAYFMARPQLKFRHYVGVGVAALALLMGGMVYGSMFRSVRGTEERVSVDQYASSVSDTFDQVSRENPSVLMSYAVDRIMERLDAVSSLAVVVSNYERLAPYEEAYGINNNIVSDLSTFFIPRVLWPDKPTASDPRRYGQLYFDYGDSSPVITPFGDLLRNFGLWGVPIGMFVIGMILKIIYRALIESQPARLWRVTLYFMLLTSVSLEGFYGTIVSSLFKDGVVAVVGLLIACFLAGRLSSLTRSVSNLSSNAS